MLLQYLLIEGSLTIDIFILIHSIKTSAVTIYEHISINDNVLSTFKEISLSF